MGGVDWWERVWGALAAEVVKLAPSDKLNFGVRSQFYAERGGVYVVYVKMWVYTLTEVFVFVLSYAARWKWVRV